MALTPNDTKHALQIQAGIVGRKAGHKYEVVLASKINQIKGVVQSAPTPNRFIYGNVETDVVRKALSVLGWKKCDKVEAIALGALATADGGMQWLQVHGVVVKACKSDVLITLYEGKSIKTVGVSVKQCNKENPTNAQLYCSTATAFCDLLELNGIKLSNNARTAMRQFCGDAGFRPIDDKIVMKKRLTDSSRFFWEEINQKGRVELESIFSAHQDKITRLLLQKAYTNDPFIPELVLHKTKKIKSGPQEFALFSIVEIIRLSRKYSGFTKKLYADRKKSRPLEERKLTKGIFHEAPRFGIIQFQRLGNKQNATQLQFNLEAGYFYNI
ncbi:MAG: hypothetical protein K8H86_14380 [Ignavibacteriaceae bacterium]|nr:hypothetical protein [Ignavibacteriaceae bacterium]